MYSREIPYLLKIITDKIKTTADADLKRHGLTLAQSSVLGFLHCSGGQATQKEIEDFLEVAHPTVVGIVSRMEKSGFLACAYDRSSKLVSLTEKARIIGDEMQKTIAAQNERFFRSLSPEELSELERLLRVVYKNLA